ncbi:BKACE family enzyme [Roseomonas marmotae]|uniref:3-keto-5-aminohexanoate cleavage protein n=1 Tax=Roseomonas marmotae TaxID=2768161 RepID=A0ABS3K7M4_9PROT|nr:3-keto-5-aminohexanoate cleavage protein [Roseomonas marmotae]MBO1073452.1 3-keto-5-aminohexanoate cleavage protein [Roseomonas marmotae]QTI80352.1 3-keto-5-aminohexanoate cleavage protein [Roseomonas marmotae]
MKKPSEKVIITCAITGGAHTPTMSPYLPVTPSAIVDQAAEAAEAGAAILHLHARDAKTEKPTGDMDTWFQILRGLKQRTNAVLNMTTGGSTLMSIEDRLAAPLAAKPELCSCNMGSMNFGTYHMIPRHQGKWKHGWEEEHLEASRGAIFRNTFADIETILDRLGANGTRFEFECYDVGHLYTLAHMVDRGLVKMPMFVQLILGTLGGIGVDPENLVFMKKTADKLFGENYRWSVLAGGRHQLNMATMAATMGGNVRVGMEDSLYAGKGRLATSNAEQVRIIRGILESLSMEIATPDEAREILGLKGGDQTAF